MKGDRLWDAAKNTIRTLLYQHAEETKITLFSLKGVGLWDKSGRKVFIIVCCDTPFAPIRAKRERFTVFLCTYRTDGAKFDFFSLF